MIEFIAAVYNEEDNIDSLIEHIAPWVSQINIVDDGSTDRTPLILNRWFVTGWQHGALIDYMTIEHTGLPETVKAKALAMCGRNSWVLMLDADERFADGVLPEIYDFINSPSSDGIDHVWFTLHEFIDGQYTGRTFAKCRLFRAWAGHFSDQVHVSDWFDGNGGNYGWQVLHSKTREKQIRRENEYIQTYQKLRDEGKITDERVKELISMHYFVK